MNLVADYRNTLRQELVNRCDRNPRYSLRAFARDLSLDPARLSDILNAKKGVYRLRLPKASRAVSGSIRKKTELFCASVEALHARSKAARQAAKSKLRKMGHDPKGRFQSLFGRVQGDFGLVSTSLFCSS